jgi:heterodisulfide reductase subunit C
MLKILSDMKKTLSIDFDRCINCGLCAKACTCHLMVMYGENPRPFKERTSMESQSGAVMSYVVPTCANCRVCIIKCPKDAITIFAELPGTNRQEELQEVERKYPRDN